MTKAALKKQLIKTIENIDNPDILNDVMRLLNLYAEMDEIVKLTPAQKKAIKISQQDVKKGRVASHHQVKKDIAKWLKQ